MIYLNVLFGLALSVLIAALAFWRGSLSFGGVVGAVLVGTIIFAAGGVVWGVLLVAFFVTSSFLSHFKARVKEPLADKFQKGHRRDLGQVLANGGWGTLMALAFALRPDPLLFVAFVGAMATVNADTWATELGVLSTRPPRLVTSGRVVAAGTSGGISPLGTFVAFVGALFIGVLAWLWLRIAAGDLPDYGHNFAFNPFLFAAAGLFGSLFDSLLGATVQAIYYCDFDQKETESTEHRCGNKTRQIRGWRWLDNDWVNFVASVFGSGIAVALFRAVG